MTESYIGHRIEWGYVCAQAADLMILAGGFYDNTLVPESMRQLDQALSSGRVRGSIAVVRS